MAEYEVAAVGFEEDLAEPTVLPVDKQEAE